MCKDQGVFLKYSNQGYFSKNSESPSARPPPIPGAPPDTGRRIPSRRRQPSERPPPPHLSARATGFPPLLTLPQASAARVSPLLRLGPAPPLSSRRCPERAALSQRRRRDLETSRMCAGHLASLLLVALLSGFSHLLVAGSHQDQVHSMLTLLNSRFVRATHAAPVVMMQKSLFCRG